ncbi:MAG: AEC family transporter [Cocleimonas sp.]
MSILFPVLFPIFVLILIGYLYAKTRPIDMEFANRLNMDVFIPALLIDALSRKSFNLIDYQPLALAGITVVLLSGVLAWFIAKGFKLSVPMFVPSMMFNNCGNMGLPLAILAWGNEALGAAVVLFLSSNLLHFTLGAYIVGGKISWWNLLKMPVNVATIIGLVISFTQWEIPATIHKPIEMLAQIAIPLMLVALGVRMTTVDLKAWRIGILGAIVCPLVSVIVAFGILFFIPLEPFQRVQLLMFAALPPAVLNYMFAEKYQQQPTEVASIVVVGNAFSIFVLSLMLLYLG